MKCADMSKMTKRPFMVTVDRVMQLYGQYMEANDGYTAGVGEYVVEEMNIKLASVFSYRYYGNFLKDHGVYDQALTETWNVKKVSGFIKKQSGKTPVLKKIKESKMGFKTIKNNVPRSDTKMLTIIDKAELWQTRKEKKAKEMQTLES
jgi:hypothetical protein